MFPLNIQNKSPIYFVQSHYCLNADKSVWWYNQRHESVDLIDSILVTSAIRAGCKTYCVVLGYWDKTYCSPSLPWGDRGWGVRRSFCNRRFDGLSPCPYCLGHWVHLCTLWYFTCCQPVVVRGPGGASIRQRCLCLYFPGQLWLLRCHFGVPRD